jgi:hypothetical protein
MMKALLRLKGGSGSGNYNHAGRPGKVGGSSGAGKSSGGGGYEGSSKHVLNKRIQARESELSKAGHSAQEISKIITQEFVAGEFATGKAKLGYTPTAVAPTAPAKINAATVKKYDIWDIHANTPGLADEERVQRAIEDAGDSKTKVVRSKGVVSHAQLKKLYSTGAKSYTDAAVRNYVVIPKSGPFAGKPLQVTGSGRSEGGKGTTAWLVNLIDNKGKPTGLEFKIPADEL